MLKATIVFWWYQLWGACMMGALGLGMRMATADYLLNLFHVLFGGFLPATVNVFDIMFLAVVVLVGAGAYMFFYQDMARRMGWLARSVNLYPELRGIGVIYLVLTIAAAVQPWGLWASALSMAAMFAFCLQILVYCALVAVRVTPRMVFGR